MTECRVTCYSGCRNSRGDGPRVWHWLCECCAEECQENHRHQTGHTDVHLDVVRTMEDLRRQITIAGRRFPLLD